MKISNSQTDYVKIALWFVSILYKPYGSKSTIKIIKHAVFKWFMAFTNVTK